MEDPETSVPPVPSPRRLFRVHYLNVMLANEMNTKTKHSFQHNNNFHLYLPSSPVTGELTIYQTLIHQSQSLSSCIEPIPCDRVAHRPLRKSRTHPHHLPPPSPVVSLARAVSVSLSLGYIHAKVTFTSMSRMYPLCEIARSVVAAGPK